MLSAEKAFACKCCQFDSQALFLWRIGKIFGMTKRLMFLFLWISGLSLWGQTDFRVRVSRNELNKDERLRVDFILNREPERFEPPAFHDFYVVMGPMESSGSQVSIINGRMQRSYTYSVSYVLTPKRTGTLTIEPASAVVEGKTYRTKPVQINVSQAQQAPPAVSSAKPGNLHADNIPAGKDAFIRLEISNRRPYVGQAVSAVYKLYIKDGIGVADYGQTQIPEPKGFWTETIKDKPVELGMVEKDGQTYRVYALRQLMLIPQHAGKLEITPQKIEMILVKKVVRQMGPFQFYDEVPEHVYLSTPHTVIEAKPLPEKGKPVDFSGAVGRFDLFVNVSDTVAAAGNDLSVEVKVTGKGNFNMFELPRPVFPPEWEVYDPEHKINTRPTYTGYKGSVSDLYTVIPQKPGKYTLPPVTFSYFDPVDETYKRLSGPAYNFEITGRRVQTSAPYAGAGQGGFRNIESVSRWMSTDAVPFWQKKWFAWMLYLPFIFLFLALTFKYWQSRHRPDEQKQRRQRQNRYIKSLLKEARNHLNEPAVFYGLIEKALREYFKNRLELDSTRLHRTGIDEALAARRVAPEYREELQALWQHIQQARYAPAGSFDTSADYEQIRTWLEKLDKILKK